MNKVIEKGCEVVVKTAQLKDNGTWRFTIGAIYGNIYKEKEYKHIVFVSGKGKFYACKKVAYTIIISSILTLPLLKHILMDEDSISDNKMATTASTRRTTTDSATTNTPAGVI